MQVDERCPFYRLVPKDPVANARFRRDVIERGCASKAFARLVWTMCRRDILFFINTFCFIYEPRATGKNQFKKFPFITWDFQDVALLDMADALDKRDIGIEKSRDQGATWMCLVLFFWRWMFYDDESYLLVSRNADLVDETGNTDTLMAKLDHLWNMLPGWMRPPRTRNYMTFVNQNTRTGMNGDTTTGDVGRGGRRTGAFADELAAFDTVQGYEAMKSLQYVTNTRLFPSTPKGKTGAFYDAMHKPSSPMLKIRLHWSGHPIYRRGLYSSENGKPIVHDRDYVFPDDYQFRCDGKLRSPWYDLQCDRANSEQEIAAELDIDYGGSDSTFFDGSWLTRYTNDTCRPPHHMMHLKDFLAKAPIKLTPMAWERIESTGATVNLWASPNQFNQFPDNCMYFAGADVAAGTGASGSVLVVIEGRTGKKILEFVCERVLPNEFGLIAVAVCSMFRGPDGGAAKLIWEDRGPGTTFGTTVIEQGYRNVYYRTNERSLSRKMTDTPGWNPTPENQRALIEAWRDALAEGHAVDYSAQSINEARQFIYTPDGSVKHSAALRALDASGKNKNHGDRVTASALAWWIAKEMMRFAETEEEVYAFGTYGWQERQDQKADEEAQAASRRNQYRYFDSGDYHYGAGTSERSRYN